MTFAYRLCTLKLESDLALPELAAWDGTPAAPADAVFLLGKVPPRLEAPDQVAPVFETRGQAEYLLALPGTGRILVRDGREVTIEPDPDADPATVRAVLTGPVQAVLWHQRGLLPLHASVVVVNGRAIALAGPPAAGKSTVAALLAAGGHRVMTDDLCVLDMSDRTHAAVLPGARRLRLWRDALDHLGIAAENLPRVRPDKELYFLDHPGNVDDEPRKLAAVVVLVRRTGGVLAIERLRGRAAIEALRHVVHTRRPARALGREAGIFAALTHLATAGVTVWRLGVPDDPARLAEAAAKVLSVLEA